MEFGDFYFVIATVITTFLFIFVAVHTILFIPSWPHFRVESLSLSNFSMTPQSVSGTWQVGFLVRNGNKKIAIHYDALRFSIYFEKCVFLSEVPLASFKQGTKSQTALNATLSAVNSYVEPWVVDHVHEEMTRGSIGFDVKVIASISYAFDSGWGSLFCGTCAESLPVLCRKVHVGISPNSTSEKLVGGARECHVEA